MISAALEFHQLARYGQNMDSVYLVAFSMQEFGGFHADQKGIVLQTQFGEVEACRL